MLGFGDFAFITPGSEPGSKIIATAGTGLIFPVLVWLGHSAAKNERLQILLEAQKKHETVVKTFVEQQLGEFMKEHQATLARWIRARQTSWRDAALVRHDEDLANTNALTIRDKHHELLVEKKVSKKKIVRYSPPSS